MAAAVTLLGTQTFNTTSGTHTVVATPASNDLIILVVANTGYTGTTLPTDNNADGLGTYTLINTSVKATSADTLQFYVRNALIGNASSTTFTHAPGTTSGGGLAVIKVTGMSSAGLTAVRQSAIQSNQSAATTPTPIFTNAPLTSNPIIGAVFNATNAATLTPRSSPSYTELFDVGYATPTTGIEVMSINSGDTATSIAWGGTSSSAFCSMVVELQFNTAPTVALNSPSDGGTVTTLNPQLLFTGTDANSDTIRYEVQIDTNSSFDTQSIIDSYNETNYTTDASTSSGFTSTKRGQSIIGTGLVLRSAKFYISKNGSPTGNVNATIYASTGTHGLTAVGTGSALATSDNLDITTLTTSDSLVTLTFTGANQITLTAGVCYILAIEYPGGDTSNYLRVGIDNTSPTDDGNACVYTGTWATSTWDTIFYLYCTTQLYDKVSNNDSGFVDITNGAHTDPFTSGEQIGFTLPSTASNIVIDSVSSGRNSTGNMTVSHTTGAGKDRMMVAVTTAQDSNHANLPVASITANGRSMTRLRSDEATGNNRTEIWYLIAPDVGTYNCVVTYFGSIGEATCGIITLTGVRQAAPEANSGATGNSSAPSVTLTTVADNAFTISIVSAEASISSINNSQTVLSGYPLTDQSYENADAASNTITPAGSTTLSYTLSSGQSWAMSALSLAPSGLSSLSNSTTYYWRTRGLDPSGTNSYGAWSSTRSFTVTLASSLVSKIYKISQAIARAASY